MNHVFVTRIAVRLGGKARLTKTRMKQYDNINDRLSDIINYWLQHANKFYTRQTVDDPFQVYLVYSKQYENVVKSFTYPDWCRLTTDKYIHRVASKAVYDAYDGKALSVSRIDADDWYSDDYFEYLNEDHEYTNKVKQYTCHLHKWIRMYDRQTSKISTPQHFSSPGFASVTIPNFRKNMISYGIEMWPHGDIKRRPHYTPDAIYGMQSVGCNVVNKWRPHTKSDTAYMQDNNRFYIPK